MFKADVNCNRVISSEDIDTVDISVPKKIPKEIAKFYSLNGLISINYGRIWKSIYLGRKAYKNIWKKEDIDTNLKLLTKNRIRGSYRLKYMLKFKDILSQNLNLTGKSILVIGSEIPWVESICLYLGAAKITTLEYGKIESHHPQIKAFTPYEFRKKYEEKSMDLFDGVISFSSLEHPGLGRYGDALNPWGDLLAVARAWCVTKTNGFLVLDLPGESIDYTKFNANRVYSKYRWPLVTTNWKLHHSDDGNFRKTGPHITHIFTK